MAKDLKEFAERFYVIEKGLAEYSKVRLEEIFNTKNISELLNKDLSDLKQKLHVYNLAKDPKELLYKTNSSTEIEQPVSVTASTSKTPTSSNNQSTQILNESISRTSPIKYSSVKEKIQVITEIPNIELSEKDKAVLRKLEHEHEEKIKKQKEVEGDIKNSYYNAKSTNSEIKKGVKKLIPSPDANVKPKIMVSIF